LYAGNGQGFAEGGCWHQTQGGSRQDTEARLESHLLSLKRSHGNHAVTRPPDGAARLSLGCGENVAKGPFRHCNQVNSSGAIPAAAMQAGKEMPGQEAPASLRLGVKRVVSLRRVPGASRSAPARRAAREPAEGL